MNTKTPAVELTAVGGATSYAITVRIDDASGVVVADVRSATPTATLPALDDGRYVLDWRALDADDRLLASGEPAPFRVLEWPDRFPELVVNTDQVELVQDGYRILDFVGSPGGFVQLLAIVNTRGEVIWWTEGPEAPGLYMAPTVLEDGSGILVIHFGRMDSDPSRVGARLVRLDWNGDVAWETATEEGVVPHHEVEILPDGRILLLLFDWKEFDGKVAEGDVIQVRDPVTGAVEWSWNLLDHFTPETWPTPEEAQLGFSAYGSDWSHSNGITWDPTRSMFWLSVRHFDALIGIDYPSGDVRAILGERGIGAGLFSHQHAPEVQPDGSILLWDNGNMLTPQVSSAKQIEFDLAQGTANIVWQWSEDSFDPAVGDADRLPNGNTLITHGIQSRVIEVTDGGQKVWEIEAVTPDAPWWFYRADHVPEDRLPSELRTRD